MKIKEGFVLREVADKIVVLPTSGDLNFNTMITLNESGAFLWNLLQNDMSEEELVSAVLKEYNVTENTARNSVRAFTNKLSDNDLFE